MANTRPFLLLAVSFLLLFSLVYAVGEHRSARILKSFSFKAPFFPGSGAATVPGWELSGSTEAHDNFIRLTGERNKEAGIMVNKRPFFLESLELTLEYKIHSNRGKGAEGMGLWLTEQPLKRGPIFGGQDSWKGVVVLVDTFDNDGSGVHPELSVHYNDGKKKFEFNKDGASTLLSKCSIDCRNPEVKSSIHLYIEDGFMNVFVDARGDENWVRCGSATKVDMPQRYFFSLSASTGSFSDNHDIISLAVNTMDEKLALPDDVVDMNKPPEELLVRTDSNNIEFDSATKEEIKELYLKMEDDYRKLTTDLSRTRKELETMQAEQGQRKLDWDNKQGQLQESLRISQNLLQEKEQGKTEFIAQYSGCNALNARCSNVRDYYKPLSDGVNEIQETFGHELAEIQFSFTDSIQAIIASISPINDNIQRIKSDTIQTTSQMAQFTDMITQLSGLMDVQEAASSATGGSRKHANLISLANSLQKTLVQAQVEQQKTTERMETLSLRIKNSGTQGTMEFFLVLALSLSLLLQIVIKARSAPSAGTKDLMGFH